MKQAMGLRRSAIAFLTGTLALGSVWINTGSPAHVAAASGERIQEIDKEVQELEGKQEETKQEHQEIENELERLGREKEQHLEELKYLDLEMNRTQEELATKESEVNETEGQLEQTAQELKEAEQRVAERDELLKTRVRAMYESGGNISYIEVLLGSSSFGDFLQRVDFVTSIMQQDQQLLKEYIRDQEIIEEKKVETENLLAQLEDQVDELQVLEDRLKRQQQEKRVQIASIEEEEGQLHDVSEEMQAKMAQMVNEQSALMKEKKEVQAELKRIEEERRKDAQKAQAPESQAQAAPSSGGQLGWPVPGYGINSSYGRRTHPITGAVGKMHNGVDISAPAGTPILAAESGVVTMTQSTSQSGGYGNTVTIDHGNGLVTFYAHIRNGGIKVSPGQSVGRGQKIAEVGTTGSSTGNHLHFEVYDNGRRTNPAPYLGR